MRNPGCAVISMMRWGADETMKATLIRWHRWAGLAAALFWFIQALTGVLIVFHWEIRDALIPGPHHPTDLVAIERTVDRLAPPGSGIQLGSIWTGAGAPDRYDLDLKSDAPGAGRSVRIDGAGSILQDGNDPAGTGWIRTLVLIHHNLLAGDTGSWIVGISGILLLTNILSGLVIAWPKRGQWARALRPPRAGPAAARRYGWHRALGLLVGIPALASVCAGVLLTFAGGVDSVVKPAPIEAPADAPAGQARVGLAAAAGTVLAAYPGSTLAAVYPPSGDRPAWQIRVTQPAESRRAYGATRVFVSAVDGSILARFDALDAAPSRAFVDGLFPFHTGEMGGLAGRIAVLAIGVGLMTMTVVGVLLWMARRRPKARA
ncbi:PepSY-associated TM helix domain-containing protein [Sphingosinicella soli]|uniref:Putative iron-regulated membrane protein n=1 Tax=Sphingosinicella soli TaxID=333708 RepID=A0A7W7F7J7_9SPHN|nr:PepSY-associated TM helix domain-containing protein [Sphingosinicella soli]MBB4632662.1 putative iron-regulated membrane protein [Sphingosinicella soli]